MEKVPIGYFGIRNSYCQRSEPLIVPLRNFLVMTRKCIVTSL